MPRIEDYLEENERPDLFEPEEGTHLCFPCYACLHASRDAGECANCRHFGI
jgi:hypothetical protein